MKFMTVIYFLFVSILCAQQNKDIVKKVNDSSIVSLLNNISIIKEFSTNELFVRILELTNEPGSAGFPNGEVTSNIFIALSETGCEYPEENLFLIPSLYAPELKQIYEENGKVFMMLSYIENDEITLLFELTLKEIKIKKKSVKSSQ